MVRKLTELDRTKTLDFLADEAAINLFIIGDIECFGFDNDFQELWGQFDEEDNFEGILLRYYESFIPYFKNLKADMSEFKEIILNIPDDKIISGKLSVVEKFDKLIPNYNLKELHFCEMSSIDNLKNDNVDNIVKRAVPDDAKRIIGLISTIEEFDHGIKLSVDKEYRNIKEKMTRGYYVEDENGNMISIAQTTAENSKSAMVVGVATLNELRNKGLASKCMSRLCYDVLNDGKTLCLFYDNPKAGSIYHRLGFKTTERYGMIQKAK
ncbi:MAG: GNAT family N-acetyltransferase [Clostridiales bacterium]